MHGGPCAGKGPIKLAGSRPCSLTQLQYSHRFLLSRPNLASVTYDERLYQGYQGAHSMFDACFCCALTLIKSTSRVPDSSVLRNHIHQHPDRSLRISYKSFIIVTQRTPALQSFIRHFELRSSLGSWISRTGMRSSHRRAQWPKCPILATRSNRSSLSQSVFSTWDEAPPYLTSTALHLVHDLRGR